MEYSELNSPFIATPTMAKLISVKLGKPGAVLEMKYDDRFKDGNFKIVKGIVRGNKNTLELKLAAPSKVSSVGGDDGN